MASQLVFRKAFRFGTCREGMVDYDLTLCTHCGPIMIDTSLLLFSKVEVNYYSGTELKSYQK